MKIYHRYIRNYHSAQSTLSKCRLKKPKFNAFCLGKAEQLGNEIISFLVMPSMPSRFISLILAQYKDYLVIDCCCIAYWDILIRRM